MDFLGNTDRRDKIKNKKKVLLEEIIGAFFASPRDIRGKDIFLRGSFALCPCVFPTLHGTQSHMLLWIQAAAKCNLIKEQYQFKCMVHSEYLCFWLC